MAAMKRFVENISEELGFGGEINDQVLRESRKRLRAEQRAKTPDLLRRAIAREIKRQRTTIYAVSAGSLIGYENVRKYLAGQRGLSSRSLDAILHYLRLRVVPSEE